MINYTNLTNADLYVQYANAAYLDLLFSGANALLTLFLLMIFSYLFYYMIALEYREDWQEATMLASSILTIALTVATVLSLVSLTNNITHYVSNKEAYVNNYIIQHMPSQNISLN